MQIWQQECINKERADAAEVFGSIYTYLVAAILIASAVMTIIIQRCGSHNGFIRVFKAWKVVLLLRSLMFSAQVISISGWVCFSKQTAYLSYATMIGAIVVIILNIYLFQPTGN